MNIFPKGWQVEPIHKVCDEIVDCLNKTATVVEGPTPYKMIRTTNVKDGRVNLEVTRYVEEAVYRKWTRRFKPRRGDVILTREAPLGEVGLLRSDEHVFLGQRTMAYRANPKQLDQRFLYYSLIGPLLQAQIKMFGAGSTVEHMRVPQAESLQIPFPDLSTQRKIAAILSSYDDLIANNQRRITLLERMAEDIYREWFVRLRFPGHKQVKIEKGVPQGWVQRRFGEFCVLKRGYDLPDSAVEPGPYPVIASTSIKAHHKFFKTLPPVITTGRSGSLGDVLYVNAKAWPLNTALYVKDFCHNSPFLIFYTLKNMGLETFNAGAGVPSLNRNHLNGMSIAVPPPAIQTAFDSKVLPIFKLKESLEKQGELLKTTRDALLPRLISGKLAVDGLDVQFPPEMAASLDKKSVMQYPHS